MSYTIAPDGSSITCKVCGLTSHNPNDIAQKFCGHCDVFHDDRRDQLLVMRLKRNRAAPSEGENE